MESWIPFFVILTAFAIVLQAIILIALFIQLRRTAALVERTVEEFNTRVSPILSRVQILVDEISPQIARIVSDASEMTRLARGQTQKADRIVDEMLERLRLQIVHIDQILTGAVAAVEEAGSRLRQMIWAPLNRATALFRGIQTGIEFFRFGNNVREPKEQPVEPEDKGLFI